MSNTLQLTPSAPTTGLTPPESNSLEFNSASNSPTSANDFQKIMALAQSQDPALLPTDPSRLGQTADRQESAAGLAHPEGQPAELLWTLTSLAPQVAPPLSRSDSSGAEDLHLRANLAASSGDPPGPLTGIEVQGLKSTALSHRMTLITSDQPVPDEVSLGDFARQQGIDEKTLRWLMGAPGASSAPPFASHSTTTAAPAPSIQVAGETPEAVRHEGTLGVGVAPLTLGSMERRPRFGALVGAPLAAGTSEALLPVARASAKPHAGANEDAPAATLLGISMPSHTGTGAGKLIGVASHPDPAPALQRPWLGPQLTPSAHGISTTASEEAIFKMGQPTSPTLSASITLSSSPLESNLDIGAVRAQVLTSPPPVQPVFKAPPWDLDLSAMLGKDGLANLRAWAREPQLAFSPSQTEGPLPTLDSALSADGWPAAESLSSHQGEDPPMGHSSSGQGNDSRAPGSREFNREFSPQRSGAMTGQELADKMSLAIGKRLLEALDRGEWQMKLHLKPADLGHVEVDLKMRGNVLEAHFTASQSITRDLLEGGMGRLKDTLQQSGMDVASMKVNDGASSRSGGDSTPRQPGQGQNSELRTPKGETQSEPKMDGPMRANADGGLDLMV